MRTPSLTLISFKGTFHWLAAASNKLALAVAAAKRSGVPFEFNAEQLAAHRAEFGLTQAQMARLIGASSLSVYKWESGKVQPRAAQKEQIAAALKLGKRAVKARLQAQDE